MVVLDLTPTPTALATLQQHVREDLESPAPDWLTPIVQWLFQDVPPWVQMAGGIVAVFVGVAVAVSVWRWRLPIVAWIRSRSRAFIVTAFVVIGILLLAAAAVGWQGWNYMRHDNDFCTGCHIMDDPFERFSSSEHSELSCHDCHRQSIFASTRQLHLWVVNRASEVSEHAPVPNAICADCHIVQDPDSTWQRISATAGHRVHLESDSSALQDVLCVNCHGLEVHAFTPVDKTCGQSECHNIDATEIVLGSMAGQTDLHCVTCHEFTAPVAETAPRETAFAALAPQHENCLSCHEMTTLLAGFTPEAEPHEASCGVCHNPHVQETPAAAIDTCATSSCHAQADTLTPFHRGIAETTLTDCVGCHIPHEFLVDGEDCTACHTEVLDFASGTRRFARMVRLVSNEGIDEGWQQPADFDHAVHRAVACTDCHSSEESHGEVTVKTEADCQACHHSPPVVTAGCEACHSGAQLAARSMVPTELRFAVSEAVRTRPMPFDHRVHQDLGCVDCHASGPGVVVESTCETCHVDHHQPTTDCIACHIIPDEGAHDLTAHTESCAGSGCHEGTSLDRIATGSNVCLACHQDQVEHEPGGDCASCHLVPSGGLTARPATR